MPISPKTIIKRMTVNLTKEEHRQIIAMTKMFGENKSQVVRRALSFLYENKINIGG